MINVSVKMDRGANPSINCPECFLNSFNDGLKIFSL